MLGAISACQATSQQNSFSTPIGHAALELTDMQGTTHAVDALLAEGQAVALVFWQTWCSSCIEEAPQLAQASRDFEGEIQFFGVVSGPDGSVDEKRIGEMVASLGIPYPQVRDRDLALARGYVVEATPTIIVLGPNREVLYRGHRSPPSWSVLLPKS